MVLSLCFANIFVTGSSSVCCHMTATTGLHGRSGWSVWRPTTSHACLPFRRCACFDDRTCALLVPGTSPEKLLRCPVSRPRGTKIDGGQFESEAQPLAVPITSDWYQRLLKIGTVVRCSPRPRRCSSVVRNGFSVSSSRKTPVFRTTTTSAHRRLWPSVHPVGVGHSEPPLKRNRPRSLEPSPERFAFWWANETRCVS